MTKLRMMLVTLAVAALASAAAASALPSTSVPFTAKYAGQASTKVDGNTANISATGTGTGTLIGKGTLTGTGTGDSSQQPCVPFGGLGKLTGVASTTERSGAESGTCLSGERGLRLRRHLGKCG